MNSLPHKRCNPKLEFCKIIKILTDQKFNDLASTLLSRKIFQSNAVGCVRVRVCDVRYAHIICGKYFVKHMVFTCSRTRNILLKTVFFSSFNIHNLNYHIKKTFHLPNNINIGMAKGGVSIECDVWLTCVWYFCRLWIWISLLSTEVVEASMSLSLTQDQCVIGIGRKGKRFIAHLT